jgi:hypothetical protein
MNLTNFNGPGKRSRYSNSQRAGRSGDRIPVGATFSAPAQTGPGAHPALYTMGNRPFLGAKGRERAFDHSPHLVPRLNKEESYASAHPLGLCGLF